MLNYKVDPVFDSYDKELDDSNKSLVTTSLKKTCQFEQICPESLQDRPPKVNVIFKRPGWLEYDKNVNYCEFKTKQLEVTYHIYYNLLHIFRKVMEE